MRISDWSSDVCSSDLTAFCIHSRIHREHPRAACVLHTHMPYATALTSLEDTLRESISQNALRYYNDVAYDGSYNGLASDLEEGARMARARGAKRVLFLANHGVDRKSNSLNPSN